MIYLCIIPFALGLICYGYAFWIISKREEINKSGDNISAASFPKIMIFIMPVYLFLFGGIIIFFNTLFLSLSNTAADSTTNLLSIAFSVIPVLFAPMLVMFFRFGAKFEKDYITVYPIIGKSKKLRYEEITLKKHTAPNHSGRFILSYGKINSINFSPSSQGYALLERLYNEKFANKTELMK